LYNTFVSSLVNLSLKAEKTKTITSETWQ